MSALSWKMTEVSRKIQTGCAPSWIHSSKNPTPSLFKESETINPKALCLSSSPDFTRSQLNDLVFSELDLEKEMKSLPRNSAPGPDGLPSSLLKDYAKELARPLFLIWRESLDTSKMPEDINLIFVTPIYKEGGKTDPKNYRPIALTSHLTKVFERVMKSAMWSTSKKTPYSTNHNTDSERGDQPLHNYWPTKEVF